MAILLTQTEMGRLVGQTQQSVGKALRGALKEARVGKMVDAAHPDAWQWLIDRGVDPTQITPDGKPPPTPADSSAARTQALRR